MKPESLPEYLASKASVLEITEKTQAMELEDPGTPAEYIGLPYETVFELAWRTALSLSETDNTQNVTSTAGKEVKYSGQDGEMRLSLHFTTMSHGSLRTIGACWWDLDSEGSGYIEHAALHPDHSNTPVEVERRTRSLNFILSSFALYESAETIIADSDV